jgi:hypothetical protein
MFRFPDPQTAWLIRQSTRAPESFTGFAQRAKSARNAVASPSGAEAITSAPSAAMCAATSGVFKLRTGAAVTVNNDVQPGNSASPKPEDS